MADDPIRTHAKIEPRDMVEVCRAEVFRLESVTKALLEQGLIAGVHPDTQRTIDALDHTANFVERIEPYLDEFRKWIKARRYGGRG